MDGNALGLTGAYEGRRVLVSGGASFIGSHLTELLVSAGAKVRVADDLSSGRRSHLDKVAGDCELLVGDLGNPGFARSACRGQEIVFHLAASHGGRGYIDTHPLECCSNMLLDHIVMSTAGKAGVERIVFASSACTYPTVLQGDTASGKLLSEDECSFDDAGKVFPDGEYGWAKLMGELQLRAVHKQYGIDAVACRIFTAYGERENESHAVVALIAKALGGLEPYPVWGDGTQTRNFTYVQDTVKGLALAGSALRGFDVVNVGTASHHTVNELVSLIFEITGFYPLEVDYQLDKPVGVKSRAADCTKAERLLGWHPTTSLEEGLSRTVDWYRRDVAGRGPTRLAELLMSR